MVENEKVSGVVEQVSQNYDGGIKIGGVWYNGNKTTGQYVKGCKKGQNVEISIDEKNKIHFLKNLSGGSAPQKQNDMPEEEYVDEQVPMTDEDRAVILDAEVKKYAGLMKICKSATDGIFGDDPKYKDSMGQHCNSLFIALDRALKEKGIKI